MTVSPVGRIRDRALGTSSTGADRQKGTYLPKPGTHLHALKPAPDETLTPFGATTAQNADWI